MAPKTQSEEEIQADLEDNGPTDANLNMSDEDFLNLSEEEALKQMADAEKAAAPKGDEETPEQKEAREAEEAAAKAKEAEDAKAEADAEAAKLVEEEEAAKAAKATEKKDELTPEEQAAADAAADEEAKKLTDDELAEAAKAKKEVDTEDEIDYKAEYLKVFAPFKANGVEIKVKSPEDAIALMQMGANYHKKMQGLKPAMKLLKLLENNDLKDEGKLNFLIDLKNKNPEAIRKLVKDSGIDPLDINVKDEVQYTPTDRRVDDKEVELDQVLESIKDTPDYVQTLNVITKQWDESSRTAAANTPQIIATINAQMADGTYQVVSETVAYERSMGRLLGISDLDAYKQIGLAMEKAGQLPFQQKAGEKPAPAAKVITKPDSDNDAKRTEQKKKVATTKKAGGNAAETTFDPLDMSDEDFEKLDVETLSK